MKKKLEEHRKEKIHKGVSIYGGAIIDDNAKELLELPPDHMIYPKISLNKLEVELEKAFAKSEWEDVKKNIENEKRKKKSELDVAK